MIVDIHDGDPEFGYRFIADELNRAGYRMSEGRVHRLCRQGRRCTMIWCNAISPPTAPTRCGSPTSPTRSRASCTWGAIKDLFSNRVVGYSLDDRMTLGWRTPAEAVNDHLLLRQQAGDATTS